MTRIEPLVFTVPEVAMLFRVSPSTVHRWIERGRIPPVAVVRYGSIVRVVRWWVEERTGRAA
jgi:excisionase family DNA binding protein